MRLKFRRTNAYSVQAMATVLYDSGAMLTWVYQCILFGLALLLYFSLTCFYNVFLHPLAKVPGPFLAKISTFWLFGKEIEGDAANNLAQLHKRYGRRAELVILNRAENVQDH
jgi:hypothetical protein